MQLLDPLQSTLQLCVLPPQLTLPEQLSVPLHLRSQESASQRTSHELPAHVTLPEQLLSAPQLTTQLDEALQLMPLEHEPGAR
ncbi:MAG TPA: hypothetical protein VFZ61_30925, partial [Polyangiales bacterium]